MPVRNPVEPDRVTLELRDQRSRDEFPLHVLHIVEGLNAGDFVVLEREQTTAGRAMECDFNLPEQGVSRRHARFTRVGDQVYVEDLGSLNGTFLNRDRVMGRDLLRVGDRIRIGSVRLRYSIEDPIEIKRLRELHVAAIHDHLTTLYNRRYLEERLPSEIAFCRRHGAAISVLVIDVDHFKQVNDNHGHPAGDAVLTALGKLIHKELRAEDIGARYGGEEFLVIARGTGEAGAMALAKRLMERVRELGVVYGAAKLRITVSIGIAAMEVGDRKGSPAELVHAADAALLEAKRLGRNRVCARGHMARDVTLVDSIPLDDPGSDDP